jgi:long-chain fatty acid transport protein
MKKTINVLFVVILLSTANAYATNGYFAHGYGVKSQGMGGVGIALPQDAIAAAINPAGMGLVGNRTDIGATWFKPQRESKVSGNNFPNVDNQYDGNDTKHFIIPEFGYNHVISPEMSLGISVYGNGGMNTDYKKGIPLFRAQGSSGSAGVDLAQLIAAPTATWKITPNQTIGAALNLAYQRFEMKGIDGFANFSSSPNHLTNKGHDSSYGAGIRVGWIGQVNETVTLGATYQSKTYMTKFDKYKGLFADGGDFDIPANYGVGIALKATPALTIATDIQRIEYSEVNAVGNASLSNLFAGKKLGSNNGPGFGWKDVTTLKIGASYAWNDQLTVRAGYNHSTQPVRKSETLFNMLAPGVVQDHMTFGATYRLPNKSELSFAYMHAFEEKVRGRNSIPSGFPPSGFGGGEADLKMYQNSLSIAYGWQI